MQNHLILIGFSGTGKTLVGREVARRLGWEFVDTDAEIQKRAGKPIPRIFAEDGEPAFRGLEKAALREACAGLGRVIATGGGSVVDPENRELMLRRGYVVCLDAQPQTIYNRLLGDCADPGEVRPLISGPEPLERISALKARRQGHYAVAHHTVHTDNLSIEETAQEVMKEWKDG